MKKQLGFSLIELAIVLVIEGGLLAEVVRGQKLRLTGLVPGATVLASPQ